MVVAVDVMQDGRFSVADKAALDGYSAWRASHGVPTTVEIGDGEDGDEFAAVLVATHCAALIAWNGVAWGLLTPWGHAVATGSVLELVAALRGNAAPTSDMGG